MIKNTKQEVSITNKSINLYSKFCQVFKCDTIRHALILALMFAPLIESVSDNLQELKRELDSLAQEELTPIVQEEPDPAEEEERNALRQEELEAFLEKKLNSVVQKEKKLVIQKKLNLLNSLIEEEMNLLEQKERGFLMQKELISLISCFVQNLKKNSDDIQSTQKELKGFMNSLRDANKAVEDDYGSSKLVDKLSCISEGIERIERVFKNIFDKVINDYLGISEVLFPEILDRFGDLHSVMKKKVDDAFKAFDGMSSMLDDTLRDPLGLLTPHDFKEDTLGQELWLKYLEGYLESSSFLSKILVDLSCVNNKILQITSEYYEKIFNNINSISYN